MKRVLCLVVLLLCLTSCKKELSVTENEFLTVKENADNKIIINTQDITSTATFVNYEVEGVNIQFVVVRGTDGKVRIAFNTCQACNPSPLAYFVQKGEYLECQNCGNRFHIDKVGLERGGCNPALVEEKEYGYQQMVMDTDYVSSYKEKFRNWKGLKG